MKKYIPVLFACLLLTGCAGTGSSEESQTQIMITLSENEQKCGEYEIKDFNDLLFTQGATVTMLAEKIPSFCIYPANGGGFSATVPVSWKDPDHYIYEQFEITVHFDSARHFDEWSLPESSLHFEWLAQALAPQFLWQGTHGDYTLEWLAETGFFLTMHTADGSLYYGAVRSVPENKALQTDAGNIFKLRCGLEKERVRSLIGEPAESSQENGKEICTWEFDSLRSVEAQGVTWSRTDELMPAVLRCEFTDGSLTAAEYHLYGLVESAAEEVTKILSRVFKAENPNGFSETADEITVRAVPSLGGDLTLIPADKDYVISWRPGDETANPGTTAESAVTTTDMQTETTSETAAETTETTPESTESTEETTAETTAAE